MSIAVHPDNYGAVGLEVEGVRFPAEGEAIAAVVKWYRADKGYGFIDLRDGGGDAFLHAKILRAYHGLETIPAGATIRIVLDDGPRGRQVLRVLDVDLSTSPVVASRPARIGPAPRPKYDLSATIEITGKVKWFDDVRGFGFVAGDDFGRDVFVHCSILGRTGVSRLVNGQAVTMRVLETAKGREAVEITT
ncbi:CspA family cold shock protein [Roseiarcus fermentans]|uniref:CspA family cold shock protein n=1 Tax=Roseiarcus fermentans TaxID=1473586 RepID=A0A366EWZ2_9HYPH|nr:cold shock domain-containing protein [Roseiarcus fermentans]RBP06436.1 CspA family cold shock protein [Roseiarcus fermentans]